MYGKNRYGLEKGDKVVHVADSSVWTIKRIWFNGKVELVGTTGARRDVRMSHVIPYDMESVGILAS